MSKNKDKIDAVLENIGSREMLKQPETPEENYRW
jgi:hypothetical protein